MSLILFVVAFLGCGQSEVSEVCDPVIVAPAPGPILVEVGVGRRFELKYVVAGCARDRVALESEGVKAAMELVLSKAVRLAIHSFRTQWKEEVYKRQLLRSVEKELGQPIVRDLFVTSFSFSEQRGRS